MEFIGGIDQHQHCLVSYEISILHNYTTRGEDSAHLTENYDYSNSTQLMKTSSIIHASRDNLDTKLTAHAQKMAQRLLAELTKAQQLYTPK